MQLASTSSTPHGRSEGEEQPLCSSSGTMSGSKRLLGDLAERPKKGSIRWDEQNLEENERIKKELNPRKIDEPKTPYLSPMDTDEEGDLGNHVRPLSLDDAANAAARATAAADAAGAVAAAGMTSDEAGPSGSGRGRGTGRHVRIGGRSRSDSDRTVSPSPRHPDGGSPFKTARSPRFSDQYYDDLHEHDDEDDEAAAADPQRLEKRRRFKEARKQHYNMREQLARARELMQSAEEETEDLVAAEGGEQQVQQQQEQASRQPHPNGLAPAGVCPSDADHFDADVESDQEGAQRQRGTLRGALAAGQPPMARNGSSAMSDN